MSEPKKTTEPEKELLTRGPSGPIALGAVIIAAWGLVLLFRKGWYGGVDDRTPPSLIGVNLSVCAMLMATLAIYRVRKMPGQTLVRGAAIAALLLGMSGMPAFIGQSIHWRLSTEGMELRQLEKVAMAARKYAQGHEGEFPPSLVAMVNTGLLSEPDLLSPWRKGMPPQGAAGNLSEAELLKRSDYIYLGVGIRGKARPDGSWDLDPKLIVAAAKSESGSAFDKRWNNGESTSIGFASGVARFVRVQEFDKVLQESNEARKKLGLGEMDEFGKVAPATPTK